MAFWPDDSESPVDADMSMEDIPYLVPEDLTFTYDAWLQSDLSHGPFTTLDTSSERTVTHPGFGRPANLAQGNGNLDVATTELQDYDDAWHGLRDSLVASTREGDGESTDRLEQAHASPAGAITLGWSGELPHDDVDLDLTLPRSFASDLPDTSSSNTPALSAPQESTQIPDCAERAGRVHPETTPKQVVTAKRTRNISTRWACPFRQADPQWCQGKCMACETGFQNWNKMRQHIKRAHIIIRAPCKRCMQNHWCPKNPKAKIPEDDEDLVDRCRYREEYNQYHWIKQEDFDAIFTEELTRQIQGRICVKDGRIVKKSWSDEEKWRHIYVRLIPECLSEADVPPYTHVSPEEHNVSVFKAELRHIKDRFQEMFAGRSQDLGLPEVIRALEWCTKNIPYGFRTKKPVMADDLDMYQQEDTGESSSMAAQRGAGMPPPPSFVAATALLDINTPGDNTQTVYSRNSQDPMEIEETPASQVFLPARSSAGRLNDLAATQASGVRDDSSVPDTSYESPALVWTDSYATEGTGVTPHSALKGKGREGESRQSH